MNWAVRFHDEFEQEFLGLPEDTQDELLAAAKLLRDYGPKLGRPYVDTLKGSKYPNMKELRFNGGGGVWRVAFAFDPQREAVLLVAGNKSGGGEDRFYKQLIARADKRYAAHLGKIKTARKPKGT